MADDLDDLLRRAMKSLDDQVPSGYFEGLPARTLARLESPPGDDMQTSSTKEGETSSGAPLAREEDSGLHDIRNLAQTTKQRLSSQKIPTRTDDDVLASSSAGWKAVALPAPASSVSLPAIEDLPSKKEIRERERRRAEGSVATAVPAPDQPTPIDARIAAKRPAAPKRGRGRILALTGAGLAAAAGAALFIATRDGSSDRASAPAAADTQRNFAEKAPAPAQAVNAEHAPAAPAEGAAIATDVPAQQAVGGAAGSSAASGAAAQADASLPPADEGVTKPSPPPVKFAKPPTKKGETTKPSKSGKSKAVDVDTKPKDKQEETGKKTVPVTKTEKPSSGDPNFDDLLKEAGVNQKKDDKPKLDKKELGKDDFTRGIGAVAGAASKCYQGQQGTAAVKIVIAPNGHVSKVTVSGVFAGTPVANCVSNAVKGATFPPWDGGPQSFNYSFLLSE